MRQNSDNNVTIRLLDKEFLIACPDDQRDALLASAKHLDQKMREIKGTGKVFGLERIAVMAALNLSHELLAQNRELAEVSQRCRRLEDRIDQALAPTDGEV